MIAHPTTDKLKPIGIFLSITLALSSIYYFLIIYSGTLSSGWGQFTIGLMWCPGLSALITMKILNRNISDLGWKWGKGKYQLWSYLIPILYAFVAYLIIWVWGGFYDKGYVTRLTNTFGFGEIGSGFIIAFYFVLL